MSKQTIAVVYSSFEQRQEVQEDGTTKTVLYEKASCLMHFYGAEENVYSRLSRKANSEDKFNPHRFALDMGFEPVSKNLYVLNHK